VGITDVQDEDDGDFVGESIGSLAGYAGTCGSGHSKGTVDGGIVEEFARDQNDDAADTTTEVD
jgi:hypothetical protein